MVQCWNKPGGKIREQYDIAAAVKGAGRGNVENYDISQYSFIGNLSVTIAATGINSCMRQTAVYRKTLSHLMGKLDLIVLPNGP